MLKFLCSIIFISMFLLLQSSCKDQKSELIYKYPNGESYKVPTINGKKNGEMLEYYSTGEIKSRSHFVNDELTGKTIRYYLNGKIKEILYFEKAKQQNGDTSFYENGNLQFIVEYTNGVKNGYVKKFDSTGVMYFNAKYKMDTLVEVKGVVLQR